MPVAGWGIIGTVTAPTERTWQGTTAEARRADRRERLLDAGLELFAVHGLQAVTVRAVCRTARLTERYFYESFTGRSQFLVALYDQTAALFRTATAEALETAPGDLSGRVRAVLGAIVDAAAQDPRRPRIMVIGALSDPALGQRGGLALMSTAELITGSLADGPGAGRGRRSERPDRPGRSDLLMTGAALAGGMWTLIIGWLDGALAVDRDRLVEHLTGLVMNTLPTTSGPA